MIAASEWLETDGLGGFASGRADGTRTRRYHALLITATNPPTGRVALVNAVEAWVESGGERYALSSHRYAHDVTYPDGISHLVEFTHLPWPTWTYKLPNGQTIIQELVMRHGESLVSMSWRRVGEGDARLTVRPLLSVRDTHSTSHENDSFRLNGEVSGPRIIWRPYDGAPSIVANSNGEYVPAPEWYRSFLLEEERNRGLDWQEDLASPGYLIFDLSHERALLSLGASGTARSPLLNGTPERCWRAVEGAERKRRAAFVSPLHRAADAYLVRRGTGRTVVAGYPWFSDWGRDTFIAMRGLCMAGNRLDDARAILLEWSQHVSEGMLPNFFPEGGSEAEYNSVDASLWYVVAVHEFLQRAESALLISEQETRQLHNAVDAIVDGYARGTRYGIRADGTGLLSAGEPGVQLTWMDAKIGDWVVTPRIGKPVEIQALWINALRIAGRRSPRWAALADVAQVSFEERFWNQEGGYLHDVVDVNHEPGTVDTSFRPNQLLALGGLPWPIVRGERARRVVDAAEAMLWTPAGPRSLAPSDPAYIAHYAGDMRQRDAAYHQGTVWPWMAGAFIEAWVRSHGDDDAARAEARTRFLNPLIAHYAGSGLGHLAEVADADAPHTPGGCPFQAWSVGEALRLDREILRPSAAALPSRLSAVMNGS